MKKDFTNVRYLKFSAHDPWEVEFYNVIIDLTKDCLVSGIIKSGNENDYKWSINIEKNLNELPNTDSSIFAKVVDSGIYHLLDENMNELFICEGYVPRLLDYYNVKNGFGDCIELLIDNVSSKQLHHNEKPKLYYNDPNDWRIIKNEPNLYAKGMKDAFSLIRNVLMNAKTPDTAISNIFTLISNFNNKTES